MVQSSGALPKHPGPPAVLLTAQARLAARDNPSPAEMLEVARALRGRGGRLAEAIALARRALLAEPDPRATREVAEWFAASGKFVLAAGALRAVADELGEESPAAWLKIARWLARAGRGEEAFEVLDALVPGPAGLTALREIAALALAQGGSVTAARAVEADIETARRLESQGASVEEFESWLRAFEASPNHPHVAEALGAVLVWRGRLGAVDEIYRQRADASGERAAELHLERGADAIRRGDGPTALAALLDAGADRHFDVERLCRAVEGEEWAGPDFDVLLERLGLTAWVAARLEVALHGGAPSSRALAALSSALRLSHPDPSAAWLVDAFVTSPEDETIFSQLLALGEQRPDLYVDALTRLSSANSAVTPRRRRELAGRLVVAAADGRVGAALGLWASAWVDSDQLDLVSRSALDTFANEVVEAHRLLDERFAARHHASFQEKIELAALLGERPERGDDEWQVLLSVLEESQDVTPWAHRLFRLALRDGRRLELWEALSRLARTHRGSANSAVLASMALRAGLCASVEIPTLLEFCTSEDVAAPVDAPWVLALAARGGGELERGRALARIAQTLPASLRAAVGAAAATVLVRLGEQSAAWDAALDAFHSDPSLARAAGALAEVASLGKGREAAEALERALQVVVPSARLCAALASLYDGIDAPLLATAWTQRWLALRPGDPEVLGQLLRRSLATRRAPRVLEAIEQLLAAPLSVEHAAELLTPVLAELAELAPKEAAAAAARVLAELGATPSGLRGALRDLAVRADDAGLATSVLEVWLDAAPSAEVEAAWLALARRRRAVANPEGAAEALWMAAKSGAAADLLLSELEALTPPEHGDGRLWAEEVQAMALERAGRTSAAAAAWRSVASLRWTSAGDHTGAMAAWEHLCRLDARRGLDALVADVLEHGGLEAVVSYLSARVEESAEPAEPARILTLLAAAELDLGRPSEAFHHALGALKLEPTCTDALAVAEAASEPDGLEPLHAAYLAAEGAALGCFGRRAIGYRAGRFFESKGRAELGLEHALSSLEAVPAEGIALTLIRRLADTPERVGRVTDVLRRLAEREPAASVQWLVTAADLVATVTPGSPLRAQLALSALQVNRDPSLLTWLETALMSVPGAERQPLLTALETSVASLAPTLEGPNGGRLMIGLAAIVADAFGALQLAARYTLDALELDSSLDEYSRLTRLVQEAPHAEPDAGRLVERVIALTGDKYSPLGPELRKLAADIADSLGRNTDAARLRLSLGVDPDDSAAVERATLALCAALDATGAAALDTPGVMELPDVVLLGVAEHALSRGEHTAAERLFQHLEGSAEPPVRERAGAAIRGLLRHSGRFEELVRRLRAEQAKAVDSAEEYLALALVLAETLVPQDPASALTELRAASARHRVSKDWLERALGLMAPLVEPQALVWMWELQLEVLDEDAARLQLHRKVAHVLQQAGEFTRARRHWMALRQLSPEDVEALSQLRADAERRGDWEALDEILQAEITNGHDLTEIRLNSLQRATLLADRLGRLTEARAQLEELIARLPEDALVMRTIGDLEERGGAQDKAAYWWESAAARLRDPQEAEELYVRSVYARRDSQGAREALEAIEGYEGWTHRARLLGLRLELSRELRDDRRIADSLRHIVEVGEESPERRSERLVEAVHHLLAVGANDEALDLSRRAAALDSSNADNQLLWRWLDYMRRGVGDAEHAADIVEHLRSLRSKLEPEQIELRAFLLAESLDVLQGEGAGKRELIRIHAEVGDRPLVLLGLAERFFKAGEASRAFDLLVAIPPRGLRGMRTPTELAQLIVEAGIAAGQRDQAKAWLDGALVAGMRVDSAASLVARLRTAPPPQGLTSDVSEARGAESMSTTTVARPSRAPAGARISSNPAGARSPSVPPIAVVEVDGRAGAPQHDPRAEGDAPPRRRDPRAELDEPSSAASTVEQVGPKRTASGAYSQVVAPGARRASTGQMRRPSLTEMRRPQVEGGYHQAGSVEVVRLPTRISERPAAGRRESGRPAAEVSPVPPGVSPVEAPHAGREAPVAPVAGQIPTAEVQPVIVVGESPSERPEPAGTAEGAMPRPPGVPLDLGPSHELTPPSSARRRVPAVPDLEIPQVPSARRGRIESAPPLGGSEPPGSGAAAQPPQIVEVIPAPVEVGTFAHGVSAAVSARASSAPPPPFSVAPTLRDADPESSGLLTRLMDGDVDAGRALLARLSGAPERAHERAATARRLARLLPGDAEILGALAAAAREDRDWSHAAAAAHVRAVLVPGQAATQPPPLEAQAEDPGSLRGLLMRDMPALAEAFALIWEDAGRLFRRDAADYGVAGLARVAFDAPTPIGQAYTAVARAIGATRVPVFLRRSPEAVAMTVALLNPLSVVVSGSVTEDTPWLRHQLATRLVDAAPEAALLLSLEEPRAEELLAALGLAFGQPGLRRASPGSAQMAETLWQAIPARGQRRLRDLCSDPKVLDLAEARRGLRRISRRVGLYVTGDLGLSLRLLAAELGWAPEGDASAHELAQWCADHEEAHDLFELAISPEYAALRWQATQRA